MNRDLVLVVDDDISVREALDSLLRAAGYEVHTFASADDFHARAPVDRAACLVLDVVMPDVDGLTLQGDLAAHQANLPIVFLTGYGDVERSVQAMKAGAVEFLTKPFDDEALLLAVEQAIVRSRALRARAAELDELDARHARLTARERDVMALVVAGMSNKQAGAALGTTEITVKIQRAAVMKKMEATSLPDLVRMAEKRKRTPRL